MLVRLGHGMAGICNNSAAEGAPASGVSAIQINMAGGSPTNWQAAAEILIYDKNDNEILGVLTPVGETASGFPDIAAGEFTSNSAYGSVDSVGCIIDGDPDKSLSNSYQGAVEWSTNASTELIFFIKPSGLTEIGTIEICMNTGGTYSQDPANVTFDFDGAAASPLSAPTDETDYFQTTNSAAYKWYRWTF